MTNCPTAELLISPAPQKAVTTAADKTSHLGAAQAQRAYRAAWKRLIEDTLMVWLRQPELLEDEGLERPSGTIVRLAIDLAEQFRDQGCPPPEQLVVDPNGGIVFSRQENNTTEEFHIWDDGSIEYRRFDGHHLLERYPVV